MPTKVGDETIRSTAPGAGGDPLLGEVVQSYKIQSLIGIGAMGMVYRGVHQIIGKAAAIKVLKADFSEDPDMVQRLIREARTVNAIRHPAIVDIFGFGTLPSGQPYIVMDLLEGNPLDQYIKSRAPMKLRHASPLLDELLSAICAAHAVGVIHRDLKPGNVFVESKPDGQLGIKVIDFGLAKMATRAGGSVKPTNPGTLLGTPAFMAPEQISGTKVTPATDLYAVGGIAYQMLTNRFPHQAPSAIEMLSLKMAQDPIPPKQLIPTLDVDLDGWVMKLLSREPEKRYQTAEEARRVLRRITDGRTSSTGNRPALIRPIDSDAQTLTQHPDPSLEEGGPEVSTDHNKMPSPWAETKLGPSSAPETPGGLSPRRPTDSTLDLPPSDKLAEPSQARLPAAEDSVLPPIPSRIPLYIALLSAIVALLAGLLWLLGQR